MSEEGEFLPCSGMGGTVSVALGCQLIVVPEGNLFSLVDPLRQQQKMNMCLFCPFQCARKLALVEPREGSQ